MDLRVVGADADAFARAFEDSSAFDGSMTSARAMNAFARETIDEALRRASTREMGIVDDARGEGSVRSGGEGSTATRVETEDGGEDSSQPPRGTATGTGTGTAGTFVRDPVDALLARARVDSDSDEESDGDEEMGTTTSGVGGRDATATAEETLERWTAKKRRVHAARSGRPERHTRRQTRSRTTHRRAIDRGVPPRRPISHPRAERSASRAHILNDVNDLQQTRNRNAELDWVIRRRRRRPAHRTRPNVARADAPHPF